MGYDELLYITLMRLLAFLALTGLIIGGVAAFGHHIAYWLASLIAFGVVFLGTLVWDGDWIA
jgi:hypothetical protein